MPIYEYACSSCKTVFEKLCSMNVDDNKVECPKCGKAGAKRMLSEFFSVTKEKSVSCGLPSSGTCGSGACSSCDLN